MINNLLEVGDIVYSDSTYIGVNRYIIDRVTNTLAMAGQWKFKREVDGECIRAVPGDDSYSAPLYVIETPRIKEKWQRQGLLNLIGKRLRTPTKITTLSLVAIAHILEEDND